MILKPNFIVVGVPKAGTTSIFHYLSQHPDIYLPGTTELRYFNRFEMLDNLSGPNDKFSRNMICKDWKEYMSYFKGHVNESAIGEITTSYLYTPKSIDRIKEELGPNTKILVLLRNPVERTYSNYLYYKRRNLEKGTFKQALEEEASRKKAGWNDAWLSKDHSLYFNKINHLIESSMPFKIILFEDFIENPKETVKDLFSFLEVDTDFIPSNIDIIYNKGGEYFQKEIIEWMQYPSALRKTLKKLIPEFFIEKLRIKRDQFISNNTIKPDMDSQIRSELFNYFSEDVYNLAEKTNIDISKWGY
jgi:hypothetical protein